MVTHFLKEKQSISAVASIYSQRWGIEIMFRAWKQSRKLSQALDQPNRQQHLRAQVLAGMSISLEFAIPLARHNPAKRMSPEIIFDYAIRGLLGLKSPNDLWMPRPDPRHLQSQKKFLKLLSFILMELLV
jgi:hypothetical protein